ncbi:Hypothetical predicted protein [Mytilus galloprovincialis]|uniref:C1q domain-containing protein n=2 Tax=Mytilus galloprovincialis TaxID=29158 RepID=A0A8B6ELC1_MYTGA|nr:Hypothetical predicted protein [Mytilus galloprovincialis]
MMKTYIFRSILLVLIMLKHVCQVGGIGGNGVGPSPVAFTATLPLGNTPVSVGNRVKYNQVHCVTGNPPVYNLGTGIFTVPTGRAGVYSVSVSMMSGFQSSHLTMRKNGVVLVWLFTSNDYNMASQTVNVNLAEGDLIFVQMNSGSSLFSVYNTFSAVKVA